MSMILDGAMELDRGDTTPGFIFNGIIRKYEILFVQINERLDELESAITTLQEKVEIITKGE